MDKLSSSDDHKTEKYVPFFPSFIGDVSARLLEERHGTRLGQEKGSLWFEAFSPRLVGARSFMQQIGVIQP